jgi:putative membrane protein
MKLIVRLLILLIAVYIASYILPGVKIDSVGSLFVVAVVLSLVNAFVKPLLIILTLPLTVLTLGIFLLVLNGL